MIDRDLANILVAVGEERWRRLASARLFVTGGTGLIGRWLMEALAHADRVLGLGVDVTVLSRDPAAFAAEAPHLAAYARLIAGDVLHLQPADEGYTHVIHAATDASADLTATDPARMFDTVVTGTRRVLEHAAASRARVLFLSSGAVYGAQPFDVTHVPEDWTGAPDCRDPRNSYAEGKRAAEMLGAIWRKQHGLDVVTARIFAVLGPLLPLDAHFAVGNFIRDALAGETIRVQGAGTAIRSYLYMADLTAWLWAMLLAAPAGATYNVGSEHAVSIADLAALTADTLGSAGHQVLGRPDPGWNPGRYVPSTAAIRQELGVAETVPLAEAIRRTARYNGWNDG